MALLVSVWTIVLCSGLHTMVNYEMTAGDSGSPPSHWPAAASFRIDRELPTLLVFAHPKCPCTRATISELSRIMTVFHNMVETHVIFLKPAEAEDHWEHTSLWDQASSIPGVNVMSDENGRLARLFSVTTSGATVLYDESGGRLFQGGITISRGHEGPRAGSAAIISMLDAKRESSRAPQTECSATTPVFGCSLCNRQNSKIGE